MPGRLRKRIKGSLLFARFMFITLRYKPDAKQRDCKYDKRREAFVKDCRATGRRKHECAADCKPEADKAKEAHRALILPQAGPREQRALDGPQDHDDISGECYCNTTGNKRECNGREYESIARARDASEDDEHSREHDDGRS